MPLQKNQVLTLTIERLSNDGSGVAHSPDGEAVFIPGTAPGDVAAIRIVKDCGRYAFGILDAIQTPSPDRIPVDCAVAAPCGGCSLRHLDYAAELRAKGESVTDAFRRIGGLDVPVLPPLPSPEIDRYRNKVQFPVGCDKNGKPCIGFYAGRTHRIVPCPDCKLQPDVLNEIGSAAPTFTMPAKEKHAKSFVLLSQNVALNKTSGGRFYRSAMQGGMCDVMAYKNDSGDQSYVSWANKDGATYIFCIMQSPDTCDDYGYSNRRPALYETTRLIDWVFESFSIQAALDTDQALAEIPVKYSSDTDTLQLYPADSMMTLLPSTGDGSVTQKYFHLPDYATAPIQQGDVVGTVELKLAGETIGVVNLIAGQDVHQNALLFTVSKVQAFFHSLYLKVVIVLSLLTLAVYGLWVFINLWNGRRPNRKIHRR